MKPVAINELKQGSKFTYGLVPGSVIHEIGPTVKDFVTIYFGCDYNKASKLHKDELVYKYK